MTGKNRKISRGLWLVGIVIILVAAVWFWRSQQAASTSAPQASHRQGPPAGGPRGMRGPLAPVQVATASQQTVPHFLNGLGTVTAANTATVRSRVDGPLIAIHFQEGQQVSAGTLLAEIDPSSFKVALAQAQGQLAKDQASLNNARRDLTRYQQLAKTQVASRQELDAQQALVSELTGTVAASQASVASAQLQLDWSRITAPISGRVGLRQIDVGNQVSSSDAIVIITQTDPIDVVFTLPESDISTVVKAQATQPALPVEVWDRTNRQQLGQGTLLSLDNQIDPTTATIKLKARFANQEGLLFPNQFVNTRMQVATQEDAIVIPASALQMGSEGHFVWAVSADNKVSKQLVTPGVQNSRTVVIQTGLSDGERVVTDGLDRLTDGAQVEIVEPVDASAAAPAERKPRRAQAS
ncbi:MdtA/MuxA family multidrug efflux RND transporter periplasmic adaptor subunit [Klebsiella sp. BIGb0407]|uniref:MdtA/MuxA family multidrug efflux RND transporter periplasmic adaptor subunit n=1 Tax=Klebsiella sp. BIGb0407 TaxID=2940603 RepID=UPI0021688C00|nr:MdtA/MuxA family multidrug efflux RND transporter periplasmic adaptor subunit [Klebsiella sp. BIGb0407]MCS3430552.1 multidrug efflux system membrane fusion protein [Klebsiella sp. BIGb0407]